MKWLLLYAITFFSANNSLAGVGTYDWLEHAESMEHHNTWDIITYLIVIGGPIYFFYSLHVESREQSFRREVYLEKKKKARGK